MWTPSERNVHRVSARAEIPMPDPKLRHRVPGYTMVALSIGHTVYGAVVWYTDWTWLLMPFQGSQTEDMASLAWFLVLSPIFALMGWLAIWAVDRAGRPLPSAFGIAVALLCLGLTVIWPLSGFPIGMLLGLFITRADSARDQ